MSDSIKRGGIEDSVEELNIDMYKATANKIDRISIVSINHKLMVKTHFIDGLGYVYCWGGACCKQKGQPGVRNVYPIIKYPTDLRGNIIAGEVKLMRLQVNNVKDNILKLKHQFLKDEGKSLQDIDLFIIGGQPQKLDNGGEYVDFNFEQAGKASWKIDKVIVEQVKQLWDFYQKNIIDCVAKQIKSDAEYFEMMKIISMRKQNQPNIQQNTNFAPQQQIQPQFQQQNMNFQNQQQPQLPNTVIDDKVNVDDFFLDLDGTKSSGQSNVQSNENDFDLFNT